VLASVCVGLLVTPLIIRELGTSTYGLWVLILAIVGYFPVFDLGFRRALIHDTAIRRGTNRESEIRESVSSFFVLFCLLGVVIMLATLLLAYALPHLFNISDEQLSTARFMLIVVGATWALEFPSNAPVAVLLGYDRYDGVNALDTLSRVAEAIATAIVLLKGGGVASLAIILASVEMPKAVARFVLAYAVVPGFRISLRRVDWRYLKYSAKRSVTFFINTSNYLLNARADELMIGAFLTVSSVGVYGVALRLVNMSRTFALQLNEVLIPTASKLTNTRGGQQQLASMMIKATRATGGLVTAITLAFIAFGHPFLHLWVGPELEDAYYPLIILSITTYFAMIFDLPSKVVLASDRHNLAAVLTLVSMVGNIALSVVLIQRFELVGVAMGTLIPLSLTGWIKMVLGCRLARLSSWNFLRSAVLPSLAPAIPAGLFGVLLQELRTPDNWLVLLGESSAVMLLYAVPFVLFNFRISQVRRLLSEAVRVTFQPRQPRVSGQTAVFNDGRPDEANA
jgi:O-antigen/teichoic acid export membrane protein